MKPVIWVLILSWLIALAGALAISGALTVVQDEEPAIMVGVGGGRP